MIRSYLDDTDAVLRNPSRMVAVRDILRERGFELLVLSGERRVPRSRVLLRTSPLRARLQLLRTVYFGGNVNVTGLLTAEDILAQSAQDLGGVMLILPEVMFNAGGLTLDGYHREQLLQSLEEARARFAWLPQPRRSFSISSKRTRFCNTRDSDCRS